jgi:hypothetical protein
MSRVMPAWAPGGPSRRPACRRVDGPSRIGCRTGSIVSGGMHPARGRLIERWRSVDKHGLSFQEIAFVRDSYDDCARISTATGPTDRRNGAVGPRATWLIITSVMARVSVNSPASQPRTSLYQPARLACWSSPDSATLSRSSLDGESSTCRRRSSICWIRAAHHSRPIAGALWGDPASSVACPGPGRGQHLGGIPADLSRSRAPAGGRRGPRWPRATELPWVLLGGTVHEALFDLRRSPRIAPRRGGPAAYLATDAGGTDRMTGGRSQWNGSGHEASSRR